MKADKPGDGLKELRESAKVISAEFVFKESAGELWPYLSQVDLIDRLGGTPVASLQYVPAESGDSRILRTGIVGGAKAAFEELPWEWFPPDRIVGERVFSEGVFRYLALVIDGWEGGGGWKVRVQLRYTPRSTGWLSRGNKAADQLLQEFIAALAKIEATLGTVVYPFDALALRPFAPEPGQRRGPAERTAAAWQERLPTLPIAIKIAGFIFASPMRHVVRMRPLAIAEQLGVPPEDVVTACLDAATRDLLILHWDVLCPGCRRVAKRVETLANLDGEAFCVACNHAFPVRLHRDIEVSFSPVSSLAPPDMSDDQSPHSGVPGLSPHIYAQFMLAPASARTIILNLVPGRYRLCSSTVKGSMIFDVKEHAAEGEVKIRVGSEFPIPERVIPCKTTFKFENPDALPKLLKLEKRGYRDPSFTAADALALPQFQRLFPHQLPAPGKVFHNDGRVFLFVDFKASTAIYQQAGDMAAHLLFQEWHMAMRHIVGENGGIVVKTLGDGAMVLFSTPRQGLECARLLHVALERWNRKRSEHEPFVVKMGLHGGPCVTFTAGGQLDYAGTAVNTAMRWQRLARGNDLVLGESDFQDDGAQEWVARHPEFVVSHFNAPGESQRLHCIRYVLPVGESLL